MSDSPQTSPDAVTNLIDDAQTTLTHACPACGAVYTEQELADADYRCKQCGLEMAHVETAPNGTTRRVLAWLRQPGEILLDRYKVEKILGKGGFATTYLVEDSKLGGRKRALKEIPKLLYDDLEEGMLSQLNHPAIPDIVDRGETEDTVYLVLKFGGGRTLENERKNRGGRIPLDVFMPWFQQLGDVISYLHSLTPPVIHRDLKPDNVLLDEHDRVMLIDFGIAKQTEDGGQTRTIARAATHGYSPPEQALGTGTDPRSDVYSLAATAYALLTGRIPPPAHIRVAGRELEPPAQLVPELPAAISDALVDALNLNINLRPQSVLELMQRVTGQTSPVADFGQPTSQTVMVGDLPANYTEQTTSVRIGTEKVTVAPITTAAKKSHKGLWAFMTLLLAAAGGAGYLWYSGQIGGNTGQTQAPVATTGSPGAATQPNSAVPANTAPAPANVATPQGLSPAQLQALQQQQSQGQGGAVIPNAGVAPSVASPASQVATPTPQAAPAVATPSATEVLPASASSMLLPVPRA